MYLVYVILSVLVILMARRRRRRKTNFQKYFKGKIDEDLSMTTLGGDTLVSVSTDAVVDTTRVSSVHCTYAIRDLTPAKDVGPFIFGVAHGDYGDNEIEEWVELQTSWDQGDLVAKEISSRRIRQIGQILGGDAVAAAAGFNDGRVMKTKLNWLLSPADPLKFWVYNTGTAAVATTAPNFTIHGHANLWIQ